MQNAHWFRWGTLNVWKFSRNISLRCAPYLKSYEFFPSTTNERIYWRVVGRTSHSVQEIFLRVWILGLIRTPNAKNRYHPLGSNILPYPYFDWTWIERIILSAKSIALKMIKPIWCWILRTRWSVSTFNSYDEDDLLLIALRCFYLDAWVFHLITIFISFSEKSIFNNWKLGGLN